MGIEVDANTLEKEIQRVFKNLPSICCDVMSLLWIVKALDDKFYEMTGRYTSTNY